MITRCLCRAVFLALCAAAPSLQAAAPVARGDVVFESGFEGSNGLAGWHGAGALDRGWRGEQSARVESQSGGPSMISLRLPVERIRGCAVRLTAQVRAEEVSAKPQSWNGVKVMLAVEAPSGRIWPQAALETGTYDWKRAATTALVPEDATAATLVLGLESVTGRVWFDEVRVVVTRPPAGPPPAPRPGVAFKGHDLPRLRGTMVSSSAQAADLRVLGKEWNANLIRWQLIQTGRANRPGAAGDYDEWLEGQLRRLDALLPVCEESGLRVVVDLHSPPGGKPTAGGYVGSDDRLFTDRACQDKFVEVWRKIATRYRNARAVWGYDLVNEPVEEDVGEDCLDWHGLAERTGRAVREIDPDRALIVEAPPWGGPASLATFRPIDVSNVVYSAHMYEPMAFTHQGVFDPKSPAQVYPGMINGKMWNRAALEETLRPVIEFQRRYNVHIYMGEFSAIRWAPGGSACRYLSDVIELFEKHGWDWSYHAFREWQGWSVEHGEDKADAKPQARPTERQRLLTGWFGRNQKPGGAARR